MAGWRHKAAADQDPELGVRCWQLMQAWRQWELRRLSPPWRKAEGHQPARGVSSGPMTACVDMIPERALSGRGKCHSHNKGRWLQCRSLWA